MLYTNELEHAENAEKILGRKSEIAEARVKKYKAKEQELHDYLLKLENSK